jgi:DNA modification methylase
MAKSRSGTAKPELHTVMLSELIADQRNARRHSDRNVEEIARSLKEFGQHRPFVVQKSTGRILVGNGMYEAMKKLGWTEGQVLYVDDDDATATRRALADNRTAELAEWDNQILKDLLQTLGPEPNIPGWSDSELEDLFDLSDWNPQVEEDGVPETPEEPVSRLGDVWLCGEHRVMCGDSTDADVIARLMNGKKAALTFTDPPYGVGRAKGFGGFGKPIKRRKYENNDWDRDTPDKSAFTLIQNYSMNAIIWGGNFFTDKLPVGTMWLVWDKHNTMPTFGDCELAWTNLNRKSIKKYDIVYNGLIGKEPERFHPTQKPVKLCVEVISDFSNTNDLIFDPFGGSGSTLIACEQTKRVCNMCELAPEYVDVIVKRWQKLTGKDATHEETGEMFNSRFSEAGDSNG